MTLAARCALVTLLASGCEQEVDDSLHCDNWEELELTMHNEAGALLTDDERLKLVYSPTGVGSILLGIHRTPEGPEHCREVQAEVRRCHDISCEGAWRQEPVSSRRFLGAVEEVALSLGLPESFDDTHWTPVELSLSAFGETFDSHRVWVGGDPRESL